MKELLKGGRPAEFLLVEDNDIQLMKTGFERARFAIKLRHVPDGEERLAFVGKQGRHADAPTPRAT